MEALDFGRHGIAAELLGVDEASMDEELARTVGAFGICLLSGLRLQLLIDQDSTSTATDMITGLLRVLAPAG